MTTDDSISPNMSLSASFGAFLDNELYSDLILRSSDGTTFRVHKVIVCTQSKFFGKACKPGDLQFQVWRQPDSTDKSG